MEAVLAAAIGCFGRIDGIIHAAGLPGEGVLQRKTREAAAAVLSPKVQGSVVIGRLAQGLQNLDFLLFCSSLSSMMGSASGQVDYCAANAFEDAYAWHLRLQGLPVASINWDMWRDVGMAEQACRKLAGAKPDYAEAVQTFGITPQEGMDALGRILGVMTKPGLAQVLVSTRDWNARSREPHVAPLNGTQGPEISAEHGGDTEHALAAIWQTLLGVENIRGHDDFFELGGDSLVATQLAGKVAAAFRVDMPFHTVFDYPMLREMSALIESRRSRPADGGATQDHQGMEDGYL